ncbi:hypothetical protein BJ165DRAFT_1405243 [Panaeolus papilionaceus]|nr:hypothetical protein BJ165DRAFT_1405243 [Panaeolus papilionaceus]
MRLNGLPILQPSLQLSTPQAFQSVLNRGMRLHQSRASGSSESNPQAKTRTQTYIANTSRPNMWCLSLARTLISFDDGITSKLRQLSWPTFVILASSIARHWRRYGVRSDSMFILCCTGRDIKSRISMLEWYGSLLYLKYEVCAFKTGHFRSAYPKMWCVCTYISRAQTTFVSVRAHTQEESAHRENVTCPLDPAR